MIKSSERPHFESAKIKKSRRETVSQMQEVPLFKRLSDRVHVVLGLNPGKFTLRGTNCYLIGRTSTKVLLDTGQGTPEFYDHLCESLVNAGVTRISHVILTHRHAGFYFFFLMN
jgi:hypothetical protein